ncbi:hypothetical protein [Streptomyces sp. NPDC090994]|uniref:hypothetical protein n=1 Tax=Streptomyces sp. NPDC090994 TaxID=3365969 RepID=UPI003815812A
MADPNALTALGVEPRPGQVSSTAAMTEAARAVRRTAGNAAMAKVLHRGGGAPHVQRMPSRERRPVYGRGGPLHAVDSDGNEYRFDHADVRAKALRDASGMLIGISFPTQRGDIEKVTAWAKAPNRTSDREFYTVNHDGVVHDAGFSVGEAHPAPWDRRPLYVHAHAGIHTFRIPVDTGDGVRVLLVDGETFAKILRHHPGFREASANTPGRHGLLMACSAGHPDATAALDMAASMHRKGWNRTWHAPTGFGVRMHQDGSDTSRYGVTQSWDFQGNEVSPGFVSYVP